MKKKYSSLKELDSEPIFDALLSGVEGELKEHLRELMQDACHKYDNLFTDSFWFTEIFGGLPIEYVLPALRRVFASFFIQIPPLLKSDQRRVELFQLQFNLEEFLTEVSSKLQGCIQKLDDYEHIECQGDQHFIPVDFGNKGIDFAQQLFEKNKIYDKNKYKLCKDIGIDIIYYCNSENKKNNPRYIGELFDDTELIINEIRKYGKRLL